MLSVTFTRMLDLSKANKTGGLFQEKKVSIVHSNEAKKFHWYISPILLNCSLLVRFENNYEMSKIGLMNKGESREEEEDRQTFFQPLKYNCFNELFMGNIGFWMKWFDI